MKLKKKKKKEEKTSEFLLIDNIKGLYEIVNEK